MCICISMYSTLHVDLFMICRGYLRQELRMLKGIYADSFKDILINGHRLILHIGCIRYLTVCVYVCYVVGMCFVCISLV